MTTLKPAYDQLSAPERAFVTNYADQLEKAAQAANEPVSSVLSRPIPQSHVEWSRGYLDRPLVRAAVTAEIQKRSAETELTPQRLINEYMAIGFSNIENYFDIGPDGNPSINLGGVTREQMSAIAELNIDYHASGGVKSIKFKLHSKMEAMKQLGEYMAVLFRDNQYWKTESAQSNMPVITGDTTVDEASNLYARMIAG